MQFGADSWKAFHEASMKRWLFDFETKKVFLTFECANVRTNPKNPFPANRKR